jgi:hypothetical protein
LGTGFCVKERVVRGLELVMNDFRVRTSDGHGSSVDTAATLPNVSDIIVSSAAKQAIDTDTARNTAETSRSVDNVEGKKGRHPEGANKGWNIKNLQYRLIADFVASAAAAGSVAPLIASIDRFVFERQREVLIELGASWKMSRARQR